MCFIFLQMGISFKNRLLTHELASHSTPRAIRVAAFCQARIQFGQGFFLLHTNAARFMTYDHSSSYIPPTQKKKDTPRLSVVCFPQANE